MRSRSPPRMTEPAPFIERLPRYQKRVHAMLERALPPATEPPRRLHEAMRYAVLNGGKRIRAILVIATGETLHARAEHLEPPACAVEFIHAYSLVHDDMPSMDDDDLRRGLPTCHRAFGEATALLAGDALQIPRVRRHSRPLRSPTCRSARERAGTGERLPREWPVDRPSTSNRSVTNAASRRRSSDMHLRQDRGPHQGERAPRCPERREPATRRLLDRLDEYRALHWSGLPDPRRHAGCRGRHRRHSERGREPTPALDKPTYPAILGLEGIQGVRSGHCMNGRSEQLAPFGHAAGFLRALSELVVNRDELRIRITIESWCARSRPSRHAGGARALA